jgi:hypothetical protein
MKKLFRQLFVIGKKHGCLAIRTTSSLCRRAEREELTELKRRGKKKKSPHLERHHSSRCGNNFFVIHFSLL